MPSRGQLAIAFVVWALVALAAPHASQAQVTGETPLDSLGLSLCSKPTVPQTSNPVLRDLLTEYRDLSFDVCRVNVGSSRVDLQACKLEYSIVSPK